MASFRQAVSASAKLVLIVEDEPKLAAVLKDYLHAAGYGTGWLGEGCGVVSWVKQNAPDLILLDLMLPGKDGMAICREIRAFSAVPIIMVTARVDELDRLLGLELGADDYVCKPFSPREVVARVKALFRRIELAALPPNADGGFVIDDERFEIRFRGQLLELTVTEFRLLSLLASKPGRVYSRDRLLDCLPDDSRGVTDRTVDSHVKNIRRKLSAIAPESDLLVSVYGVGYKIEL